MSSRDLERTSANLPGAQHPAQLADVLERVLDKGIVIAGDIQINLLDIELLTVKLRLLIASADKAKEMGIDWWQDDPFLSRGSSNGELEGRLKRLERATGLADDDSPERVSEATVSAAPTALYAYGVVPAGTELDLTGAGVDSTDVHLVQEGDLAALVGVVPLTEFGEEPLRTNLEDRGWLERTAQAHEGILESALAKSAVVPFRIATVYGSEESLREFLQARHAALTQLLQMLAGKVELGVKAYFDRVGAVEKVPDAGESGSAYLRRRQAETAAAREADTFAAECARTSHERLSAVALDARTNRPQPPELSGRTDQMLLNGAYLVPRGDTHLEDVVRDLEHLYGGRGVTYEITGPWPAYNFVPRDLAGT